VSYGVHAYAVDLAAVKKTIGSGNAVLAKRLAKSEASELEQIDDVDFDEGLTRAADVLRRLIVEGAPAETDEEETPGYKFGYALEVVCRSLGEWLPNSAFSAMGSEYFETLDRALEKAKSKRKVASIVFRGSPVRLPEIEDFPAIGWLSADEVQAWRAELQALLGAATPAAAPSKVELVFVGGGSKKFWRGSVKGSVVTVAFGRIGTAGQTKPKKFKSPADAVKGFAALVKEKRAKGYVDDETAPAFSGRVLGKKLVVSIDGKQTVKRFPTNEAAQSALIAALKKSNSGGASAPASKIADPDAAEGLRELLSWLDATAAKKRDLVTFFY
jgi:predicted DNA-binding WGR domain protein